MLINLIPWRAIRRARVRRRFFSLAGLLSLSALLLVLLGDQLLLRRLTQHSAVTAELELRSRSLAIDVDEFESIAESRRELKTRTEGIDALQNQVATLLEVLEDITRTLPVAMYLQGIELVANTLSVEGVSSSNADLAEWLRALEGSPEIFKVGLSSIITERTDRTSSHHLFRLDIELQGFQDDSS